MYFFYFLFILIIFKNSNCYIVLPFKFTNIPFQEPNNSSDSIIENFLSQININQLYATLSLGNPPRNIDFYLSMEQTYFSVLKNNCLKGSNSSYDPSLSDTFKNETPYNISIGSWGKACVATEKCSLYNDVYLSKTISLDSLEFIFGNNTSSKIKNFEMNKLCGNVGLMKQSFNIFLSSNNFIYYLKNNKIIDSYSWGIFFFDKENKYNNTYIDIDNNIYSSYDGFFIAGITNNSYLEIFKSDTIDNSYTTNQVYWDININKIYFNTTENEYICSNNIKMFFSIDLNYIIADQNYYKKIKEYFFKKYLDENICIEEKKYNIYEGNNYLIVCNKDIKNILSSFPKIYFFSEKLSYTFNLDYSDVFLETEERIYFLISNKEKVKDVWSVGKIFIKKYPFIFDYDKKTISFVHLNNYNEKGNKEQNTNYNKNYNVWTDIKIYIFVLLLIVAIVIGIFIGKTLWKRQRKMRANELDDNYDYIEKFDV